MAYRKVQGGGLSPAARIFQEIIARLAQLRSHRSSRGAACRPRGLCGPAGSRNRV